eukprot:scaffold17799_cov43-Prasinocladus_malaysianus.AAC.3
MESASEIAWPKRMAAVSRSKLRPGKVEHVWAIGEVQATGAYLISAKVGHTCHCVADAALSERGVEVD